MTVKQPRALSSMIDDYTKTGCNGIISRGLDLADGNKACIMLMPLEVGNDILTKLFGEPLLDEKRIITDISKEKRNGKTNN